MKKISRTVRRRRREAKTDYKSRLNLLKSGLPRLVIRKTNKFVTGQIIESEIAQDPDKRDYIVSNDKIESTGWKPNYSIDDGIKELIKGYKYLSTNPHSNI